MARRATLRIVPTETLPTVGASWARHLRAEGKSSQTISTYLKAIHSLSEYLPAGTAAASVTRDDLIDWLNYLRDERHYAPATLSQRHRSIQQLFRHLLQEGDIDRSPLEGLSPPKIPDTPPPVLTVEQMRALLDAVKGPAFADRRDTAMLRVFMATGIRRGEQASIRLADVDLDRETLWVNGKTGRRIVSFSRKTTQAMDRYLRLRAVHKHAALPGLWLGERGVLSVYGIEQAVKHAADVAGLPFVSPHVFRHSFVAHALGEGQHQTDVASLAGWSNGSTMISKYGRAATHERAMSRNKELNPAEKV